MQEVEHFLSLVDEAGFSVTRLQAGEVPENFCVHDVIVVRMHLRGQQAEYDS